MSNLFIDLSNTSVLLLFMLMCNPPPPLPMLFASGAALLAPLYVHAHLFAARLYVSICALRRLGGVYSAVRLIDNWHHCQNISRLR